MAELGTSGQWAAHNCAGSDWAKEGCDRDPGVCVVRVGFECQWVCLCVFLYT